MLQGNTIATFTVMALEESVKDLVDCISELANLYDASVSTGFALTGQGHSRVVQLQEQVQNAPDKPRDIDSKVVSVRSTDYWDLTLKRITMCIL